MKKYLLIFIFLGMYLNSSAEENESITNSDTIYNGITGTAHTDILNTGTIKNDGSHGITGSSFSLIQNFGTIKNNGDYGIDVSGDSVIVNGNGGKISNNGSFGIRLIDGKKVSNLGIINNKGEYGITAYSTKEAINEKSGIISNDGNTGFYIHNSTGTNDGTISNSGNYGFTIDSDSKGVNNGIIANKGKFGVAVYNSIFINSAAGEIKNGSSYGLAIQNGGYGENYGIIANKGNVGVSVSNSSSFVNHGTIEQEGEIAILMGNGNNTLELGTASKIKGIVEGNKGTDTLILSETPSTEKPLTNGTVDFTIQNFSNIAIKSGTWNLNKDMVLVVPDKFRNNPSSVSMPPISKEKLHGTFIINSGIKLTLNIQVSDLLTPTLSTGRLINNGTINERPIDSLYVTNDTVIKIPTIYIKDNNNSSIGKIDVTNVAEGWLGNYEYDKENGILYLILNKKSDNPAPDNNIVGGFYDSVYNYPKSNIHEINNMEARERNYSLNREFNFNPNLNVQSAELITSYGKYYGNSYHPAYSYRSYGFNGQSIFPWNNFTFGLNYGYIGSKADFKDKGSSTENIDSFTLIGSISYLQNNWLNIFQTGLGYSRHDLKRRILDREDNYNKREIDGKFNSFLTSFGWETGYILSGNNKKNYVYPYAGLDYIWNKDQGYNEKQDTIADEDNYALNVKKNTSPSLISKAGVKYKYNISEYWNINGDFTWYHSSKKPRNTHADFIFKPDVHYTIPALKVSKDTEVININASYTTKTLLEYNIGLHGLINRNHFESSLSLGIKYTF